MMMALNSLVVVALSALVTSRQIEHCVEHRREIISRLRVSLNVRRGLSDLLQHALLRASRVRLCARLGYAFAGGECFFRSTAVHPASSRVKWCVVQKAARRMPAACSDVAEQRPTCAYRRRRVLWKEPTS